MHSLNESWLPIFGALLSLGLVIASVLYVNTVFKSSTQDALVRFVMVVFTSLVAVYVADKVIAFKMSLLTEKQSDDLFDLIKTLTMMIFAYYFGTKKPTK